MVRTYKRKSHRGSWQLSQMELAAHAVRNGEMSIREASAAFGVPKSTLERHKNRKVETPGCLGRFHTVLDAEFERELAAYCCEMQDRLFGLTARDLRALAFELAQKNRVENKFSIEKRMAGKDWLNGFLRRHKGLSIRTPEPTSIARAAGFRPNHVQVDRFYDLLENIYKTYQLQPCKVWNVDETSLVTVHKPSRIIGKKGQHQVGKITSGEKSKTITAVCCFNATGSYIPPMMVFPRVNTNERLLNGAPPLTIGAASKNGWIDTVLFKKWFDHFVKTVKPTLEDPHLLLLDGHVSHKSPEIIDCGRKTGVILLCFPPHTTHALQPLDCVFYGPLKTYYNQACESFMTHNPFKRITDYDVAALFNRAYVSAATLDKGVSGFEQTGIYPFNRHRIHEYRFAPSIITDNTGASETFNEVQQQAVEASQLPGFDVNEHEASLVFDPSQIGQELTITIMDGVVVDLNMTPAPTSLEQASCGDTSWRPNSSSALNTDDQVLTGDNLSFAAASAQDGDHTCNSLSFTCILKVVWFVNFRSIEIRTVRPSLGLFVNPCVQMCSDVG